MGILIIHIGPPKTATTSLQYYWQTLNIGGFKYLGINQPRENKTIGSQISKYLLESKSNYSKEQYFKNEIKQIVSKNKITLLSEEAILVEQLNSSIKDKLLKFSKLIDYEKAIIIFATREPSSVYFSYYLEIFRDLPQALQNDFEKFQQSCYCDCFKYEKLITLMRSIGFKKFHYFNFESLTRNELSLNEILGTNLLNSNNVIKILKKNSTPKKTGNIPVTKNSEIKNIIKTVTPSYFKNRGLGKYINNLSLMKNVIELKKTEVLAEINEVYKSDIAFLETLKNDNY